VKVILQENVSALGSVGDIVNVAAGYGRNYLLPRKKAVPADERNLKVLNHQKLLAQHQMAKSVKSAQELAKRIESLSLSIARQAGENDKLYGSVTNMDIEAALKAEGVVIDRRIIQMDEPIKNIGVFNIDIKLHTDVKAKLKVWVVQKA